MPSRLRKVHLLALAAMFVLIYGGVADACPTCKESLSQQQSSMDAGYALSIGLMMATPALILVGWVIAIWRLVRRARFLAQTPKLESPA